MGTKVDCVILGASPLLDEKAFLNHLTGQEFLICADGGVDFAKHHGLCPNCIVGDFDSAKTPLKQLENIISLPRRKDDTDLHFAAKLGLEKGFQSFLLAGVLGGSRPEHTVATLATMAFLQQNGAAVTATDGRSNFYVTGSKLFFKEKIGTYLSVFAYGGAAIGVSITGASYPLSNAILTPTFPIGVSNEITEENCMVLVQNGQLLVITTPAGF